MASYFTTSLNVKRFETYTPAAHPVSLVASNTGHYFSNVFNCLRCHATATLVNELDCICAMCGYRMFIKIQRGSVAPDRGRAMVRAR
jgi:DNA-directed RNA polymerase subunit RPC12/RpoP